MDEYALRLGDDCLVLAQRLCEWSSRGPELEEDVALTNIALDLLGQARALLTYAGALEGRGRDEDALAYGRDTREFLNCQLVELPNGDFAQTMARQLLFSAFQVEQWNALRDSADTTLAAVAARAAKEAAYHREHAELWVLRLGDGTEESRRRMQAGLDATWPYTAELFESDALVRGLVAAGVAVDPACLRPQWSAVVTGVVGRATLRIPESRWAPDGGRRGLHTEAFGLLLAEMQHLHRAHPGARW
ncbi:MAG TPA: 1,2-phenylacetyl-CoA epoxidase subunit PaaC [Candidatus Dormibacteraeota bacterium]|nr:1,2-phenylacetyl-CoA epoxidase subunit PaaC [Candidatus Dormibacteraeota bacterium]